MTSDQTIAKLQAAQGDPLKLALVTLEIVLASHPPELRRAIEAAAIPHWFNQEILAALLEIDAAQAAEYMGQLQRLPMVEPFPAREGWNVHETTRLALRSDLASTRPEKFRKLSALAVTCFKGDRPHERVELLYHLLVVNPSDAKSIIGVLRTDWDEREELLAVGPPMLELIRASLIPSDTDLQIQLVRLYQTLGPVARSFGQSRQALVYLKNSESIAERLAQAEPNRTDLQRDLSVSYERLGDLAVDLGQHESAQAYFQKSHAIRERLAQAKPNRADLQRDLSISFNKLGDLARSLGQNESAQAFFQKDLAIAERLAQAEPNRADLQRDLLVSYVKLGDLAGSLGQNDSASAYFQKSLAIAERLAEAEPNRADLQRDLSVTYAKLNDFPRALAILEALNKDGRMLPTDEKWLTRFRELVQKSKSTNA